MDNQTNTPDEMMEAHVRSLMFALPFSSVAMPQRVFKGPLLDDVATFLQNLKPILIDHIASYNKQLKELDELRGQRAAVRAFLGIGDQP